MSRRARPWYRRGRRMWYVQIQGKQHGLGITDPKDEAGAEKAHQKLVDELGLKTAALGMSTQSNAANPVISTVARAVDGYLAAAVCRCISGKITPECLRNYRWHLAPFVLEFGSRFITQVSADEIEEWADKPTWASSTQHNVLGTVRQVFKREKVPINLTLPPMESAGPETVLSDAQFAAVLIEVRRKQPNARGDLVDVLRVLRETGARPSEIASLTVEAVDWGNACVLLRKHKSKRKTGKDRLIVFNTAAMLVLNAAKMRYGSGLLFRTRWGNRYKADVFNKRLRPIGKTLGFRVTAYGLGRHSFCTKALIEGIPEPMVAALMGHGSTAMIAKHYSHVGSKARAMREASEIVSRATG